jgi:hypothetical protein
MGFPNALKSRLGAYFWSLREIGDVRYAAQSGKYMLALSFSAFDPSRKSAMN